MLKDEVAKELTYDRQQRLR